MFNRCKIIIEGKEYFFLFDNNSLLLFCDLVGIDIGGFGEYAQAHQGTLSRDIFYTAAKVADLIDPKKDEDQFNLSRFEFGNLMTKFGDSDWSALTKAFEASRPEQKKKTKRNRKRLSR